MTAARYAALAVYDAQGIVTRFVHHGMDPPTVALIGKPPQGRGLLGATLAASGPVRIADLQSDPRSCGFPAHHPSMRALLAAPLGRSGRQLGNLYLTDPIGRSGFDADGSALVMTLAALAAGAIEGSQLLNAERARADAFAGLDQAVETANARRELLAAVIAAQESERARVARDIHDDIGQALTSVLLGLRLLETPTEPATERSHEDRIDDLRRLVADALRRTRQLAFELRPTVVEDDGDGFDPAAQRGQLGLQGMRERAELLAGTVQVVSAPGCGTSVVLEVPL